MYELFSSPLVLAKLSIFAVFAAAALALLVRKIRVQSKKLDIEIDSILESISEGVVVYDHNMRLQRCNRSFREIYALTEPALVRGATLRDILSYGVEAGQWPEAQGREDDWIEERLAVQANTAQEMLTKVGDDQWILVRNSLTPAGGTIGIRTDVTELENAKREAESTSSELKTLNLRLQEAVDEISYYANHDALTGLINRRRLDKIIDALDGESPSGAHVMQIDLDRFKQVNDTFGHAAGDAILVSSAQIIRTMIGPHDLAARVGGDEFIVLMYGTRSADDWLALGGALVRRLATPIAFERDAIAVGASIGVAPVGDGAGAIRTAMLNADVALYRAKAEGRDCARYYTPKIKRKDECEKRFEDELRAAIENDELSVLYQPQFDAASLQCVGAEALVRWPHPTLGLLEPDHFFETAHRCGMLASIDRFVLRTVQSDFAELLASADAPPRLTVNVSASSLSEIQNWSERQCATIGDGVIALELQESVALDEIDEELRMTVDTLRELGFEIEIDDFGSDRASIMGLSTIRPDRLKIDPSLIAAAPFDASQAALVRSILDMAKALKIDVVAEGVETADHIRCMRDLGCRTLQGFALGRPAPLASLRDLLRRSRLAMAGG